MAKIKEKAQAINLRKQGRSIGDIARQLQVSKSTVSVWCRDISLTDAAMRKIAQRSKEKSVMGLMRYSESIRKKRITRIKQKSKEGAVRLGTLSDRDIYCIGLGLYWGEGYKQGSQEFGFTNSDPHMITFYIQWLQVVFGVEIDDLILRVSINNVHMHRIAEVESFWAKHTGVPRSQFTKISLIKTVSKKKYQNIHEHMGTLRIKVRKGTDMRREVLGAIQSI